MISIEIEKNVRYDKFFFGNSEQCRIVKKLIMRYNKAIIHSAFVCAKMRFLACKQIERWKKKRCAVSARQRKAE